jgi:hypothetical protein
MEKILDVQEILVSIREDDQQLEKLIADLKKEEKPSAVKHPAPAFSTVKSTRPHPMANPYPRLA